MEVDCLLNERGVLHVLRIIPRSSSEGFVFNDGSSLGFINFCMLISVEFS